MTRLRMTRLLTACCVSLVLLCGCDVDWPDRHGSSAVEGTVEFDGSSLVDAKVLFLPQLLENGNKRVPLAFGQTDARGKFILKTDTNSVEVAPQIVHGRYRVLISKKVDGKEILPESYNRKSELRFRHDTQEAYSRPVFRLFVDGRVEPK